MFVEFDTFLIFLAVANPLNVVDYFSVVFAVKANRLYSKPTPPLFAASTFQMTVLISSQPPMIKLLSYGLYTDKNFNIHCHNI